MTRNLLGYGHDFELLQFAYDLTLWSTLGAQRNIRNALMRILTSGSSFTPIYWKRVSNALIDVVRQMEMPRSFFTLAPYEWTAPYHRLLSDEMEKMLRRRLRLPVMESLHMAHLLFAHRKSVHRRAYCKAQFQMDTTFAHAVT